ncbi:DUF1194 domain-containing protein [Yoonia sp. 208BN28-4]|uniref:DUF1194 domain-containing protein n=1 Tax=Yoonia sp. 208BN28-4 TaxID=3126505 RepID=UPI00309C2213
MLKTLGICAALGLWSGAADACRLALVLAMDVSNSVDAREDALQRNGLASALLHPDVQDAFLVSSDPVSLLIFEWSGQYNQDIIVDWVAITSPEVLFNAANTVANSTRIARDSPTSLGYALGFAATKLREVPACANRTIDVAGDGKNNHGFGPAEAYAAFPFDNVIVNGLVIDAGSFAGNDGLIPFYRNEVLRGPGAFLEIATRFEDFEETMRRKLLRELLSQMIGRTGATDTPTRG